MAADLRMAWDLWMAAVLKMGQRYRGRIGSVDGGRSEDGVGSVDGGGSEDGAAISWQDRI